MIAIDGQSFREIVTRVAASPREEVCGLLLGNCARVTGVRHTANVATDRATAFEIDPEALFAALREERRGGPRVVGHYHSHPNGSTAPSPRDLAAAEPGRLWLILGQGHPRLWRAEVNRFDEVPFRVD